MASYVAAYRIGSLIAGAGALLLVATFQAHGLAGNAAWRAGYVVMAALVLVGVLATLAGDRAGQFRRRRSGPCRR